METVKDFTMPGTAYRQIAQVYETMDYGKFSFMDDNRDVNMAHVDALKKSFQSQYLLAPILVNENFEIVDGQHRFTAAKQMNFPVRYVVAKGYTIEHVKVLNHHAKNWSTMDHFISRAKSGNQDYLDVMDVWDDFGKITKLSFAGIVYRFSTKMNRTYGASSYQSTKPNAAAITPHSSKSVASNSVSAAIKSGKFESSGLDSAINFATWVVEMAKYAPFIYTGHYINAFLSLELYNSNYSRKRATESLKNYGTSLSIGSNTAFCEKEIERIYNYNRSHRVHLARV